MHAGMLKMDQFPINYFGVSDVEQWFDDFVDEYADTGKVLPGSHKFWRFNRIHDYGDKTSAIYGGFNDATKDSRS